MDALISFLTSAATSAGVTELGLLVIIVTMLGLLYRYVLNPTLKRVENIPTKEDVAELFDTKTENHYKDLTDLIEQLKRVEEKLVKLDEFEHAAELNMVELRRDIEVVKTILNQFQGHMLYNRRSVDFGNQELK